MAKRTERIDQILDVALEILKNQGDFGLTMRKVAKYCEITLSSLQYYFKTRDDLLKAMVEHYFHQYIVALEEIPPITNEEELGILLHDFLSDGYNISDAACILREYWALSTRNEVIRNYLDEFYESFNAILYEKLTPIAVSEEALSQSISILIPYLEGYSIVAQLLPENLDSASELLKTVIFKCLKQEI